MQQEQKWRAVSRHVEHNMSHLHLTLLLCASLAFLSPATAEEGKMDRKTEHEILVDLKAEEGFRAVPYRDTLNNWTVGYGHHLGGRQITHTEQKRIFGEKYKYPMNMGNMVMLLRRKPMTKAVALTLLRNDVRIARNDALRIYDKERWESFPRDIKVALMDMLFNLGINKYLKFKKHIKAMDAGDYDTGAEEVIKSLAYTQAPHRYQKIYERIINAEPDPPPRVCVIREDEFPEDSHHWNN